MALLLLTSGGEERAAGVPLHDMVYWYLYNTGVGVAVVETISDARRYLTRHVARFRKEGFDAEPVVFGDHRTAEAAVLPYETFQLLLDVAEDIAISERIRERGASDSGVRSTLADVAAELGVDLDDL